MDEEEKGIRGDRRKRKNENEKMGIEKHQERTEAMKTMEK